MNSEQVLSREQLRSIDRLAMQKFGMPSIILMENAGRSCAETLIELGVTTTGSVCICCGRGNNGGDGFVMARHLSAMRIPVEVLVFHSPREFSDDAAINLKILEQCDVPVHQLVLPRDHSQLLQHFKRATWIVDALLGTGAIGPVRPPYDAVIPSMNEAGRPILAIDVPSGLDCDLGTVATEGVIAQATITLVASKPGFRSRQGKVHCGEITVGSIGIPRNLISYIHSDSEFAEFQ